VRLVNGIPTTCLPRTIIDLGSILPPYQLDRAFSQAEIQRLHDPLSLPEVIARYPSRKGIGNVRKLLDRDTHYTRSDLEALFIDFARRYRLPELRTNFNVIGHECDVVWPDHALIVELDARSTHLTGASFEQDRERDRILQAAGWRVVRVTGHQLNRHARELAADLRRMLAARSP
jgi:very-short-patch-repair endonuclease